MQNIKGKVIAITGASSGMGKAIAMELAKNGAKIVLGGGSAKSGHWFSSIVAIFFGLYCSLDFA
ncbi:hypothetical protein SRABI27_00133 [Pedobacter sp. Bi27]|nr:SDR family NAD(P)-dependent oxidoreductase [Pedobacter sp. Bi27]CAH0135072.1 hypothetical protein SRABI27_00133 [Pedobacter sp. Bi27]